ncbi:HAD family hydrolase [Paracoccus seriniphilus]|uniref:HAD family hydrolase n=1 Tax=Paracoccus seriniphilus TaxID=184748 RepID=UPI003562317E
MTEPLLIFDCDGVLVDSEPISISLLIEYCAASGFEISAEDAYRTFLGKPVGDATMHIKANFDVSLPALDTDRFQHDVLARFERDLAPVNGVADALARISFGKTVASSSNLARIRRSLQLTGLEGFFGNHIFSTDMVARGKPHPDVFLHAARQMDALPENAIVIEDSPAGLIAAKAAGMRTIAFAGGSHAVPADLENMLAGHQPDRMIRDMDDLPATVLDLAKARA